ncbi:MAG: aminotransferase class V-fold PLP-dependent enzyme [Pseudomonadota bacterium]
MSEFPLEQVRRDTRGLEHSCHFNNAGASLMPAPVVDRLTDWLRDEELRGGYEVEAARRDELEDFYRAAAELLNCQAHEVAYVENATRAWNMAFYGLALGAGDTVLTPLSEYGSNVIALRHQAARRGFTVEFMADDEAGVVDLEWLAQRLGDRSRPVGLIALSHVPTGNGLVNPAAAVGALARAHEVPYLLDACQSLGQMPVDVQALGCDMLSGTGRKYLRGPRGTGLLYVRREFLDRLDPPFLDQHAAELNSAERFTMRDDARRFECWERYCAGQAALAVALRYASDLGLASIYARVQYLAETLRGALGGVPGVEVVDGGHERCGIVTFTVAGREAEALKAGLGKRGVNVSVASGSGNLVWFEQRGLTAVVRASVHYFNTPSEIDRLIASLLPLC